MKTTCTIISVGGADATEFLQGQLSNDVLVLDDQPVILTAWCNPKGRVITVMSVSKTGEGYELRVPTEISTTLVQRMTMFRFRSKVDFELGGVVEPVDLAARISSGIPWITVEQSEKFTPHMLNLDKLDAISLDKGCYTGQEIVARTHYKGATKRRMRRFESAAPVNVGDKISDRNRDIGEVLNVAGRELLAVIPTASASAELIVGDTTITPRPLPYSLD